MQQFQRVVQSEQELREVIGTPHEAIVKKTISVLDENCQKFIEKSPLLFMSTSDATGMCDVSPRGDGPGFVHLLDDRHLIIPDRPGNRRVDSMLNILSNPHVGLIFLIPGAEDVLRVNGRATIIRDEEVLEQLAVSGTAPTLGIVVEVLECFIHCPRAFKKSKVWDVKSWPAKGTWPAAMEMFYAHLKINGVELD